MARKVLPILKLRIKLNSVYEGGIAAGGIRRLDHFVLAGRSMRLFSISALVVAGLFAGSVHGATFSIVSGHVDASATAYQGTGPTNSVTDAPPAVTLGAATLSGSVSANAQFALVNGAVMVGTVAFSGGVSDNSVGISVQGKSSGFQGQAGASGSGDLDVIFNLDAPATVNFSLSQSMYCSVSAQLFDGNSQLLNSYSGSQSIFQDLSAGTYELKASGGVYPLAGTGNTGSGSFHMSIVPEPAMAGMLTWGLALFRRRRRA
ncbi:MAG TPA: hypothetical protein VHS31_14395 [Tepidisphaeraceae bacterium]|nr:hypothetical protein [Tepidisphaeraceae bacterium]